MSEEFDMGIPKYDEFGAGAYFEEFLQALNKKLRLMYKDAEKELNVVIKIE